MKPSANGKTSGREISASSYVSTTCGSGWLKVKVPPAIATPLLTKERWPMAGVVLLLLLDRYSDAGFKHGRVAALSAAFRAS